MNEHKALLRRPGVGGWLAAKHLFWYSPRPATVLSTKQAAGSGRMVDLVAAYLLVRKNPFGSAVPPGRRGPGLVNPVTGVQQQSYFYYFGEYIKQGDEVKGPHPIPDGLAPEV
jgi:hypothetical protein